MLPESPAPVAFPGKRRTAREMAVQMLYQNDVGKADLRHIFGSFDLNRYLVRDEEEEEAVEDGAVPPAPQPRLSDKAASRRLEQLREAFDYARVLVQGTVDHLEAIDQRITEQADNWRLERMPVVDRNVLRLAVYEMTFQADIPRLVVVDEAIELAKRFGSENSSRFVNGLLDGLMKLPLVHDQEA